ncbi:ATP-binding protein [Roseimarinus sediminis]|uniref:ATP-binding protein n=1 Tax=Roseimarinus sediminis TaxID=1610899 RepID=UPI003D261355
MKLLSRFIWLIVGITAVVFSVVTLFQIKASNEFELIKNSIKEEYDVQVDKMITPDPYSIGFASYANDLLNTPASAVFLSAPEPGAYFVNEYLIDEIMQYHEVDAVWFFKNDGSIFYNKSIGSVTPSQIPIPQDEIPGVLAGNQLNSFYKIYNNQVIYYHGGQIVDTGLGQTGYLLMASLIDQRWIDRYEAEINNSEINVVLSEDNLQDLSATNVRITRELKAYNGSSEALLNIELNLPFLSLWNQTNSTDKWIMTGSLLIIVIFLVIFLIIWVISPLKNISSSLQKGSTREIKPMLSGKTEMSDIARLIADYHHKTGELEASESVKRHIFEQAQVGILIADAASGHITTINPYACKMIGIKADDVLGNKAANFLETVPKSAISDEAFESIMLHAGGESIPVLRTITQMVMDGKQVEMNTFVDLREIKSLQDSLEEEKQKLSLAMENSGLIFCEYNFKTDQVTIDKNWSYLSSGNHEYAWMNLVENIHDADRKTVKEQIDQLAKGVKNAMVAEFRVKHPQRGIVWLNVSLLITKRDELQAPLHLIGLLDDITERIQVQQELIKAKEKAEESDRMKSSYLGNMSHKIRTPLNTIVGFANLLSEEELETDQKENFINIIRNDTEQVLHLIDDMINLAKIDANQLDINKKQSNANKIINQLAAYYRVQDKAQKIDFVVKTMLPDGKDLLQTDSEMLYQALNNMVNNAFKFTEKGSIELGYFVNPVDSKMILYVKDTGKGIPDESRDKLFNRFYQVDPMTEGTGLGLTITESIVKLLGGKLYFDSKLNQGSTFYIELPYLQV